MLSAEFASMLRSLYARLMHLFEALVVGNVVEAIKS